MGVSADFDRSLPLFERSSVPCEFIGLASNSSGSATITSKKATFYTLRLLEGRRRCEQTHRDERVIRFEVSDECSSVHPHPDNVGEEMNQPDAYRSNVCTDSQTTKKSLIQDEGSSIRPVPMQMQATPQEQLGQQNVSNFHKFNNFGPVHLYELEVSESDYADLRRDQALLVDFPDFAKSFVSLLNFCDLGDDQKQQDFGNVPCPSGNSRREVARGESQILGVTPFSPIPPVGLSRYTCRLEDIASSSSTSLSSNRSHQGCVARGRHTGGATARFLVVESNQFRELTHLSLNLNPGTDSAVRSYLSARLGQTMGEKLSLQNNLRKQSRRAVDAEASSKLALEKLQKISMEFEVEKRELKLEADEQRQRESQKWDQELKRIVDEKDETIRNLTKDAEEKVRVLQEKLEETENVRQSLFKEKCAIESANEQLNDKLVIRVQSVHELTNEVTVLKGNVHDLEEEKKMVENSLHQTQLKVAALEQSNESQESAISQADALKRAADKAASQSSESLEMQKSQLEGVRSRLADATKEILKGNQLAEKLQREKQEGKHKLKTRAFVIKRQEEVLSEKDGELSETRKKLGEAMSENDRIRNMHAAKERELHEAKQKLAESAKLLESNQQVITWLNREINEVQLSHNGSSSRIRKMNSSGENSMFDPGTSFQPYVTPEITARCSINTAPYSAPSTEVKGVTRHRPGFSEETQLY